MPRPIEPDSREVREFVETYIAQARAATKQIERPGVLQMILVHPNDDDVSSIYRYSLDDDRVAAAHDRRRHQCQQERASRTGIMSMSKAAPCAAASRPSSAADTTTPSRCSRSSSTATPTRARRGLRPCR